MFNNKNRIITSFYKHKQGHAHHVLSASTIKYLFEVPVLTIACLPSTYCRTVCL